MGATGGLGGTLVPLFVIELRHAVSDDVSSSLAFAVPASRRGSADTGSKRSVSPLRLMRARPMGTFRQGRANRCAMGDCRRTHRRRIVDLVAVVVHRTVGLRIAEPLPTGA